MKLNIREMINGGPTRLRYVFRYSTCRVNHPESVAEHSYYVAFYCMLIAQWCEWNEVVEEIDTDFLLCRALLHDLEEARSGDFPRPFKYSSEELKKLLETASREAFVQTITPIIGESTITVTYIHMWRRAKDESVEGRILEFADFLAVLSFLMQEGLGSGNKSIEEHCANMDKYFDKFSGEDYNFIRPLVDQAAIIMREMWGGK